MMTSKNSQFRSILQLMRFPAIFTSWADIFLGAALVAVVSHETLSTVMWDPLVSVRDLFGLLLASGSLYLSGMVFNDVFDVQQDRIERPDRPIPSGRITRKKATYIAALLMGMGCGAALLVSARSFTVSLLISVCVLSYDGILKATFAAPIIMGMCRALNVILGATISLAANRDELLGVPMTVVSIAICNGIYVAGVTCFARQEAAKPEVKSLFLAMLVVNLAFIGLAAGFLNGAIPSAVPGQVAAILPMIVAFTVNRRACSVLRHPEPRRVQATVRTMLMSIIMLDAILVYGVTGHVLLAIATATLVIPALGIGRWLYVT